jgi:diketogulonate reductase-like aldo/keto reductase
MTELTDTFKLTNGVEMPKVGFGTWQISRQQAQAVTDALDAGYRHIDTALVYGNEKEVGAAIRDSGVPREELFITTKLPAESKSYAQTLKDFDTSLSNLGLAYVDLYLIHAPQPWSQAGSNFDQENREVWQAMEAIYASGRAKAIGVSNFNVHDLSNLFRDATITPMVDQIQYYVGYTEPQITRFAQSHQIQVEAYSPLATGSLLNNRQLQVVAARYHVSLAQLAIQFCVQNGVLPLPKATHRDHITSNAALDFTISSADMAQLNGLQNTASSWHFN